MFFRPNRKQSKIIFKFKNTTVSLSAGRSGFWRWTCLAVHGNLLACLLVVLSSFVFLGMSGRLSAERLCCRGNAPQCVSLPVCEDDELLTVWPIKTSPSSLLHSWVSSSSSSSSRHHGDILGVLSARFLILEAVQGCFFFFSFLKVTSSGAPFYCLSDTDAEVLIHSSIQCEKK